MFRQALLLLGLAFLPAIGQAVYHRSSAPWNQPALREGEVRLEQARDWGDSVIWVDARPDEQFERDRIPLAVPLNQDRWDELLPQFLEKWSPDKRVIVYCSTLSCALSHDVARRLREQAGLPNVYVLNGGWEAWQEALKK
ncbi:MAG TPA: rhodanese-like domain-containing protein [Chthoniobacterales bacterium]|nr:rhodanese-like domain-containing protein [Chthoniobacterales bacterium]